MLAIYLSVEQGMSALDHVDPSSAPVLDPATFLFLADNHRASGQETTNKHHPPFPWSLCCCFLVLPASARAVVLTN